MGRNKSAVFRVLKITGVSLMFLLMLSAFAIYMTPHFGWRVDGLRSGSMAPQLNTGDMVITRPAAVETVKINDIIIFRSLDKRQNLISHRVIGIETNPSLAFQTKGDANESPDPFTVPAGNLVGELAFHVPLLGYAVLFLQTTSGLFVFLVFPGIFIALWCLKSLAYELAGKIKDQKPKTKDKRAKIKNTK
ncbi:MAG: signal peptidase I [Dehalococcoidales bacterium]|nr:signal peptidase I [Dehalococcoidales bacterium]